MTRPVQKPRMTRLCGGVVFSLVVGVALAVTGARMISGISQFGVDTRSTQADMAQLPQDDLLRQLSQELAATNGSDAQSLSEIAPAAGAPLGQ